MTPTISDALLLALVLMASFAAAGFNRPSWVRSYTSFTRYHVALLLYVGFYLAIMLGLHAALVVARAPDWQAIWGALACTALLRTLPSLSRWLRSQLRNVADVPDKARELATALADTEMVVDGEIKAQASGMLRALGIGPSCDWFPKAQPLHDQLSRAAWLFVQITDWGKKPAFERFANEAANELYRLRQRFDAMSLRVSRMLASIELLGQLKYEYSRHAPDNERFDEHLRRLIGDMISDACEDVSLFHRDACLVATRGVLATEVTRQGRARAFADLGFLQAKFEVASVYRVFPFAAGLLFVGMWLLSQFLDMQTTDLGAFMLQVLIVTINVGAIAIAVLPKLHYGFANGGLHRRTPWPFVVGAGLCAVAFAATVNVVLGAALDGWEGVIRRLTFAWPYFGFSLFTASATAWLIQDHRWSRLGSGNMRCLADATVFAFGWLAASIFATIAPSVFVKDTDLGMALQLLEAKRLVGSFLLGAAMGALIPEYTRRRPKTGGVWSAVSIPASISIPGTQAPVQSPRPAATA